MSTNDRFFVKDTFTKHAFKLYDENSEKLFTIGQNDICIKKKNFKFDCYCDHISFEYPNGFKGFVGKHGMNHPFILKRIEVWQMKGNLNQRKITKSTKDSQIQQIQSKFKMFEMKLISSIEKETKMKFKEVIFDSNECNWERYSSRFDEMIFGKDKLVFIIDVKLNDTKGRIYGVVYNKIDKYVYEEIDNKVVDGEAVVDEDCFVITTDTIIDYSLTNGISKKSNIHSNLANCAFKLYPSQHEKLFTFGKSDISVYKKKKEEKTLCTFKQHSFDLQFTWFSIPVERIIVLQMEESKKHEEERLTLKNVMKQQEEEQQRKQIEELTNLQFNYVVFDSYTDDWKLNTSTFDKKICGKRNLIFVIEDNDGNVFGSFLKTHVDINFCESNTWNYRIKDENSFVFSIKRNNSSSEIIKFDIKTDHSDCAFILYKNNHDVLFSVGYGPDICIMKEDFKNICFCKQHSFNYNGKKNVLRTKNQLFQPKRIQVWQMKEKLEEESYYQRAIEELTKMKIKETIFDTNQDNWNQNTSVFDEKIFGKEKIVVVIDDIDQNIFGAFIDSKIDRYWNSENKEQMLDSNSFIFSLKSNGRFDYPMKFNIKPKRQTESFYLYQKEMKLLFTIGNEDICVMKQEFSDKCHCKQTSFDCRENSNVLVGKEGKQNPLEVKRIKVWQMEEEIIQSILKNEMI